MKRYDIILYVCLMGISAISAMEKAMSVEDCIFFGSGIQGTASYIERKYLVEDYDSLEVNVPSFVFLKPSDQKINSLQGTSRGVDPIERVVVRYNALKPKPFKVKVKVINKRLLLTVAHPEKKRKFSSSLEVICSIGLLKEIKVEGLTKLAMSPLHWKKRIFSPEKLSVSVFNTAFVSLCNLALQEGYFTIEEGQINCQGTCGYAKVKAKKGLFSGPKFKVNKVETDPEDKGEILIHILNQLIPTGNDKKGTGYKLTGGKAENL